MYRRPALILAVLGALALAYYHDDAQATRVFEHPLQKTAQPEPTCTRIGGVIAVAGQC
ncbi:hypothetical protein [Chthonobacter rhizosphaerae]|uniref:hypothetical protein n=1 Tax=Chthonobacter rhizosphaerae TaxID=2735553 RepID=UPI0015EFCE45|nr:hypothetical protein [Chthonobacter rhizosphaerae]